MVRDKMPLCLMIRKNVDEKSNKCVKMLFGLYLCPAEKEFQNDTKILVKILNGDFSNSSAQKKLQ